MKCLKIVNCVLANYSFLLKSILKIFNLWKINATKTVKLGWKALFGIQFVVKWYMYLELVCILKEIETTQKEVVHIVKRNETNWIIQHNLPYKVEYCPFKLIRRVKSKQIINQFLFVNVKYWKKHMQNVNKNASKRQKLPLFTLYDF